MSCCRKHARASKLISHLDMWACFCMAGHWQNKPYPYAPYQAETLGNGILMGLDMGTEYWWCWLALGVNLAYIFLLNGVLVLCLTFLPPYGANAVIAKTEEELYDRHVALYGDVNCADDVIVDVVNADGDNTGSVGQHDGIRAEVRTKLFTYSLTFISSSRVKIDS